MKILKKNQKILFLLTILMMSSFIEAKTNYAVCGPKPGLIDRLLNDAEKIRLKCIDDIYKASQVATNSELAQLAEISKKLDIEIKQKAIKIDKNYVQCSPKPGERARDRKIEARCQELIRAQNVITERMNNLRCWGKRPRPKVTDKNASIAVTPPCPTKEKLDQMQVARMFNRKLFVTYERCVTLNPENYFDF